MRLPSLDGADDTTLDLTFGDPSAADRQTPAAVWDASYAAVLHFTAATVDSTANHNDGLAMNGLAIGTGQIGGGLAFDGVDDYLDTPASASLSATATAGTFSLWIQWVQPSNGTIIRW